MIRMRMADEDSILARLRFMRIQPQPEPRQVNSAIMELNFQAFRLDECREEAPFVKEWDRLDRLAQPASLMMHRAR